MTKHLSQAERRSQILRSAREEFIKKGYESTRVEDVAKRAGLSKGAVYFYFASKHDLFTGLIVEEHDSTYAFLEKAEQDDRPALIKLLDLGQRYMTMFAGLKSPPRLFLLACELAVRDAKIRDEVHAVHQRFVDAVTRILAQGMAEGDVRPLDPAATALTLKAMIDGFAGQSATGLRPDPKMLIDDALGLLLRGILLKPELADDLLHMARQLRPRRGGA